MVLHRRPQQANVFSQGLRACEKIERNAAAGVLTIRRVPLAAGSAPWIISAAQSWRVVAALRTERRPSSPTNLKQSQQQIDVFSQVLRGCENIERRREDASRRSRQGAPREKRGSLVS
jgi:hypothetical protein